MVEQVNKVERNVSKLSIFLIIPNYSEIEYLTCLGL